jgi:hypothetical protein
MDDLAFAASPAHGDGVIAIRDRHVADRGAADVQCL